MHRPVRVCFPFVGDVVGGSHISVLGLLRNLDRTRFDPLVVVEDAGNAIDLLLRTADVEVRVSPLSPRLAHGIHVGVTGGLRLMASWPRLARWLRRQRIDIVHTNDGRSHAVWAIPAKLAGARLVWHHRGDPAALGTRHLAPVLADTIISVSQFALGDVLKGSDRAAIIHSPFDVGVREDRAVARAALVRELGCPPTTRLIGFFGALIDRKRPLLFVEAIAAMRRIDPSMAVRGLLFGEEYDLPIAAIQSHAVEHGVGDAIGWMGYRYPGSRWLAACDLLMVPAVNEPFGRTLIEAMLVGTPIVATRSGGNAEALRNGTLGVLVEPENPVALGKAALTLLADPATSDILSARAQSDARQRFGEGLHAQAVMARYDGLSLLALRS